MSRTGSSSSTSDEKLNRSSSTASDPDSRLNQTLRSVQGLLKGQNLPGKVLLTRRPEHTGIPIQHHRPPYAKSLSEKYILPSHTVDNSSEEVHRPECSKDVLFPKKALSTTTSEVTSQQFDRADTGGRSTDSARVMKFTRELSQSTVRLETLREVAWSGVPPGMRPDVWRLLLGYAPSDSDRRESVLRRKRSEYLDCVSLYYDVPDTERSDDEISMLRQIALDCPRTVPDVSFFRQEGVQKSLERLLYIWAIRHPASGYVQGINDLVTPFLVAFLSEHLEGDVGDWRVSRLSPDTVYAVEADCYWCLSKLLQGMQDHYTFAQPGIQRLVFRLKELVRRIDAPVSRHMEDEGLEFLQFAFRWVNCLLVREVPFHLITRLWDTYVAEGDALPDFLVYVFASFLLTWSGELMKAGFQDMIMMLQRLPTHEWTHVELEMVLSRAYVWHAMFSDSPSHLSSA